MDEVADFLRALSVMDGISAGDVAEMESLVRSEPSAGVGEDMKSEPIPPFVPSETDLRAKISTLNVPGRLKLGMFGNSLCRGLLIMDSSRLVQFAVLANPRLTLGEVEAFAKNPNMPEQVLRTMAGNRQWMRSYLLKLHLVTNPRTPQDVALKWLRYLRKAELRRIAKSKNLPQIVAITARKILASQEKES